ncbi:MAG: AraC family transcriptional regulator [Eubacteriales bacterium]|nr:AraC family transcriptional regulator [Eubacteriales bacterium]
MNQTLLDKLRPITPEERALLDGRSDVQRDLYTNNSDFVVDSQKMLAKGKLIAIRPHTRFVHFPVHRHNFVEIIYMCAGSTTHILNGSTRITLREGDLLFLNQNATQEILPAGEGDIAVNFMILPEFFDRAFLMMEEKSVLQDFLIGTLRRGKCNTTYLHFQVHDILPIQNLVENMIYALVNREANTRNITQTTMGLLFSLLTAYSDRINQEDPSWHEQNMFFASLKYIETHYQTATLEELAAQLNQPPYALSRLIRKQSGQTFKSLLQTTRLNQAAFLLSTTRLPVDAVISLTGYDNTSYFHRIFRAQYGTTPLAYRKREG